MKPVRANGLRVGERQMRVAYLDCFSGISGDMVLGALVDLGFKESTLGEGLAQLPIHGYEIAISRERRQGLEGTSVKVCVREAEQPHRHHAEIRAMLSASPLPDRARRRALEIFDRLAQAEARVHGIPPDRVAFHEVGAVDSIVDIVGVALGLDALGIETAYVSALPLGEGLVQSAHGLLPIPAPATAEILKGMQVKAPPCEGELVTPTGAAIAAVLAGPVHLPMPLMRVERVGYGVGRAEYDHPNLLRVFLGEQVEGYEADEVEVLECQIDDLAPELYPHLMDRLLQSGATDVYFIPVQMKKGRPGILVHVLALPARRLEVSEVLFTETTTLGVRFSRRGRIKLKRWSGSVETDFGPVPVKMVGGPCFPVPEVRPEYEACREVAERRGVPLRRVYEEVVRAGAPGKGTGHKPQGHNKTGKDAGDG